MDLLRDLVAAKAQWSRSVSQEAEDLSRRPGWEGLSEPFTFMPQPLDPTAAELQSVRIIRDYLASPGDLPRQHIGEAETIAIIQERYPGEQVLLLTEDKGVIDYCSQLTEITPVTTLQLFQLGVRTGRLTREDAVLACDRLRGFQRPVLGFPPFD